MHRGMEKGQYKFVKYVFTHKQNRIYTLFEWGNGICSISHTGILFFPTLRLLLPESFLVVKSIMQVFISQIGENEREKCA